MRGARRFLPLYHVLLRTSIATELQYRASNAIWMLGGIIEPTIYLAVWSAVAGAEGRGTGGWDARDFAAYYVTLMFVNHLTFTWLMHVFQLRIQEGDLALALLRPIHPIHADVADNLAYKLVMLAVLLPGAAVVALTFAPRFSLTATSVLLFLPALLLAFAVRFLLEWTLALAAFWTTRVTAINNVWFTLMIFLSGRAAPVEMLPGWLQQLCEALPFYWMVAFPVGVFLGHLPASRVLSGCMIQLAWIAFALGLLAFAWRRALRRFSAVGG